MARTRRKRITRRQLKEDKFVSYTFRITKIIRRHLRPIMVVGSAVIVILILSLGYIRWSGSRLVGINSSLAIALKLYSMDDKDAAREKFEEIAGSFANKPAKSAYFYLGNIAIKEGRYAEARSLFQQFLRQGPKDDILVPSAYAGIAQSYEEEGNPEEAARAYEETFRRFSDRPELSRYLLDAARCYQLAGDKRRAAERYMEIMNSFPDSRPAETAERKLKLLYPETG